jgi:penicillin V acylase-like amidase (Ntn superfamily)
MDEVKLIIHESKYGVATKHGTYKSKAEMNRAWCELMRDPKCIAR